MPANHSSLPAGDLATVSFFCDFQNHLVAHPEFWKGAGGGRRKTMYQPRRTLSQMHTTSYMPFTREKGAY